MNKITTIVFLLVAYLGYSQNAPVDFEPGGNGDTWTWTVFENSTNPPLQVIANPDATGVNTSANVAEFTALQAGMPFAGVESLHGADIGTFTLDATNALVKIWVWKPVISNVGIKFATFTGASTGEILVPNTLINQWEELTFDFSGVIGDPANTDIDQIVIFPDFDARTQDNVVYFDQITFGPIPPPTTLPFTFEAGAPVFNDFNGSFTQVIANPDATGVNTSANVAENTVPANAAFAGVNIVAAIDLTTNSQFRMDVWSPLAGTPVLLKLEGGPNAPVERQANLTTTGAWEEVLFDFSSEGALTYDSVTVFMNFNMVDPNTQTYYWDNLETFAPPLALPLDFEGAAPAFNDFNGSFTQVIANPDATGQNTSANVAENTVPANAAFAGVNIVVPVDITTDKFFTMDVWSPLAGTPVLLKLEGGPNAPIERQANLTTTGAWEQIVFDFSSEGALTYDSVTVFMNFNMVDPNTQTYYWDNLASSGPPPVGGPNVPIDFEAGGNGAAWTWTVFENDSNPPLEIIANPDPTGPNTSATVAKFTALQAGMPFAGVESMHGADIGTFTLDATNSTVKIMVWKPVISNVGVKFATNPGASTGEILVPNTLINQWEELTFDFSGVIGDPATIDIDQIIIFPDFDARTQDNIIYFDNITLGASVPPMTALPLDFEGAPPTFNDFNGSFTQVIANPDATGVNTSANVAENTVPANAAFAGVNIVVPVDITTDKFFRMDVWSPIAGTPVLLKLEGGPNAPIERQANLTTTGAWEEIVFDFSSEGALTYDSVTVFMNFNVIDPNSQTYFWDNLELYTPPPPPLALPLDFEGAPPTFNDFNGSFTQVIANPDATGVNTSANVAENTVPANAAFAGVNIVVPVDITTDKFFRMDVWSPIAGTPVLLKLEGGPNAPIERQANLTTSGAWEEIVFDFSSEGALTYDSVTVFMNFNVIDPNTQTYFWDNLELYTPAPPVCDITLFVADNLPAEIDPGATQTGDCANAPNLYPVTVGDPGTIGVDSNIDNVALTITHTFDGDLDISLVSPSGAELLLSGGNGGGGDNFIDTVFMDGAGPLSGGAPPYTGTFEADGGTFAAAFDGESITGDWNLKICDNFGGDTGTVDSFTISICRPEPPTNDECVNAFPVACGDVVVGETITFADTGGNPAPDVWYSFTGTGISQVVTLSLCDGGTDYDSFLRVFDACGGTEIATNDDSCGLQSELSFASDGTSTYYIMVEGFASNSGNFSMEVTCVDAPPNDDCAGAISMACGETVVGETDTATFDATAPVCVTGITAPGVWYEFTDATGLVTNYTLSMCDGGTDYDSKITVYSGDCGALACVVDNDDTCGLQSEVSWQGDGLTTYYILVHGFGSNTGNFSMALTCAPVPPPNDMIANSIDVDEIGFPYTDPAVAMPAATTEGGNPVGCNIDGANGVWYNFVPDGDGFAMAEIVTPGGASSVTFYTADDENATESDLTLVDFNGNQCVPGTSAIIPTAAGQAYYVFVLNNGAITDITIDGNNLGTNENAIQGFTYYPNPTAGVLNLNSIDSIDNVAIYNLLGQQVLNEDVEATSTVLDVSRLAVGAYVMKVSVNGEIGTYKIIKR